MTLRGGMSAALIAAALIAGLPANAQTAPAAAESFAGQWEFRTGLVNGCTLFGSLDVLPGKSPGVSPCMLIAYESCETRLTKVRQSCTARSAGENLTILSKVEELMTPTHSELGGREPFTPEEYRPDNFHVTRTAPDEMKGGFFSWGQTTVRFWRKKDLTS
jgi:hypothetical protein